MAYKWNSANAQKFRNAIRNYNRALNKQRRNDPYGAVYLPENIKASDVVYTARFENAQEANDFLNSMRRATREGAFQPVMNDKGVAVSKWQLNEAKLKARRDYNRVIGRAEKMLEEAKKARGKKRARMLIQAERLKDTAVKTSPQFEQWGRESAAAYMKALERTNNLKVLQESDERYKKNYLNIVREKYGKGSALEKLISGMSAEIVAASYFADPYLHFEIFYMEDDFQDYMNTLQEHWEAFARDYV